jgi:hypothetical protein
MVNAVTSYAGTSCPDGYNDDDKILYVVQREHVRQVLNF